jgi:hypothetical protein
MSDDLLKLVGEELVPVLAPLGFRVVASEVADVFDNASVVLESPAFRIRVLRERSIVVLDLGPRAEPGTWFDSAVVMEYLGLSTEAGFHDRDARGVIHGVGLFIQSMWDELTTMFGPDRVEITKDELHALREERAARLFGG